MIQFDQDQLMVYQVARDFVREADRLVAQIPTGHRPLANQLRRAADSIVLNIAEGAGEFSVLEKCRFYRIARRSANECVGSLHLLLDHGIVRQEGLEDAGRLLRRVIGMLINLIRGLEEGAEDRA